MAVLLLGETGTGKTAVAHAMHTLSLRKEGPWPGNVRELENVILRAITLASSPVIEPGDIVFDIWSPDYEGLDGPLDDAPPATSPGGLKPFHKDRAEHERAYFQQLLEQTGGNVTKAAQVSGLSRQHVYTMMKKYGLVGAERILRPASVRPPREQE